MLHTILLIYVHTLSFTHTHTFYQQTDTFYAAMRLLLPHIDRARPAYGLKEVALAKHYIEILSISKESTDSQKLLHYRAPQNAKQVNILSDDILYTCFSCIRMYVFVCSTAEANCMYIE